LSSNRLDLAPPASPEEAKADPVVNGFIVETASSPKEALLRANRSPPAAAPRIAPSTGMSTGEAISATIEKQQSAPPALSDTDPRALDVETPTVVATAETKLPKLNAPVSKEASSTSDPASDMALPISNTAHPIDATTDDGATSRNVIPQRSLSPSLRSNDSEPAADVLLTEGDGLPAVAAPVARFGWFVLLSRDYETTDRNDRPVYRALTWVRPPYLVIVFVMMMVIMSYYLIFKTFQWGHTPINDTWPDDIGVGGQYNDPEFYRKLRQATRSDSN
jgi:hypothetical protein